MSSLKNTFKYILFTFMFMFLFMPSVKADTKYLICDYDPKGDVSVTINKVRVLIGDNSFIMSGGKENEKWKANPLIFITEDAYSHYTGSSDDASVNGILDERQGSITSCYDPIYIKNGDVSQGAYQKSSTSFTVTATDITCWYREDSHHVLKYTIPSSFYGVNNVSVDGSTKTLLRYLPISDTGGKNVIKWQDISTSYHYLKHLKEDGCPKSVAINEVEGYMYVTNVSDLTDNELSRAGNMKGTDDDYHGYNLTCNKDVYNNAIEEYSTIKNDFSDTLNEFDNRTKKDWTNYRNSCSKDANCLCKDSTTNNNDYVLCELYKQEEQAISDITKHTETNQESVRKVGCGKFGEDVQTTIDELKKITLDKIKSLCEKDIISYETYKSAAEKINEDFENLKESVEGLIDDIFAIHDSELKTIANNKNKSVNCDEIFGDDCDKNSLSLMCFITTIFNIIRYLIPSVLIILGSIDFAKVVISNEKEAMSKSLSLFIQRIIIAIAIFFLPLLINFLLKIFDSGYSMSDKINCVIESLAGDSSD